MKRLILISCLAGMFSLMSIYNAVAQDNVEIQDDRIVFTPDDNLNKEQKIRKYKICDLVQSAIQVENGKVVISITEDDFVCEGISVGIYHLLCKNVEELNEYFKNNNLDKSEIERMMADSEAQYKDARSKVEF